MEQQTYADRKSRLVNHRADSKVPDWHAVGSVTIHGSELPHPLYLDGVGYTVVFTEARRATDLRAAEIYLRTAYQRAPWWAQALTIFSAFLLGCIVHARFFRY